jgi:uncharacterized protein
VIDDHCHPFALEPEPFDPASMTLDVEPGEGASVRRRALGPGRLSQELLVNRLAARFGCAPDEVGAARAEAAADWPAYVAGLFKEAGLTGLVMDVAFPAGAGERLPEYEDLAGCPVRPLMRLEPLLDSMIGEGAGAADIAARIPEAMAAAAAGGTRGFKTVVAYRTGLAVDPEATMADAERSLQSDLPVRRRGKALRDLVLRRALGVACELGLPMQVHTGLGDSELRLAESNPLLLEDLLRTPEGAAATVVLIHGSFPWHDELAYLAATKANVWADVSLFNIFSPATVADRLMRLVDLAPAGRLLMGTDGHGAPETFWFAALVLREAWQRVRTTLSGVGATAAWIDRTERMIFEENAGGLYGF